MNIAIRAHRILSSMENYEKFVPTGHELSALPEVQLGELIGHYRNPGPAGEVIGIFSEGLAWFEDIHVMELRFDNVAELAPAHGKESEALLLKMKDGNQFQLPVKGRRGQFLDSMEMLRFLDRVIQDVRGQQSAT